ncbi:MAG: efflux transporter outer membrane subunit [Flavobacterium sp.]|nr:efflux transporter outer membrane subunit [Flavobacterium sp.]
MKKNSYKIILLLVMAVLLQSCFSAKTYHREELATENLFRATQVSTDSSSIADLPLSQLFTDPILQKHIDRAIQQNLDLQIALQNIAAAEATMRQGRVGYLPSLSLSADHTHQQLSRNSQFGALLQDRSTDQFQFAGNLSWEADVWGKIRSNKRATEADYLESVFSKHAIQTRIVADVASSYFQLLALDAQLRVADSTLANRRSSIETIQALKDAGSANEVGVKQTEAQLYATQLIIEDIKANIVFVENAISILLGESPRSIERGKLEDQTIAADIEIGLPATLLSRRPDVIAAEYALISNFEYTNVARSNFYPSLRITATGGFQSIDIQNWFDANSLFANVLSGITQPIFNRREIKTRYEIAQANQRRSLIQFQQSLLNAGREVSDALQDYQNETAKMEIRTRQLESLKQAATFSDELLNYGLANYLEVLTAKDQALNSELNLIDNKYRQFNAVVLLYRALGGGWQ